MSQTSATDEVPEYNPDDRLAPPPENSPPLRGIEVTFAIDTYLTSEQWERIRQVIIEVTEAPCNTPKEGTHWLCSEGCKPLWSKHDALMLGKPVDPTAPDTGEPSFDSSIHVLESAARELTAEDRQRKLSRRR